MSFSFLETPIVISYSRVGLRSNYVGKREIYGDLASTKRVYIELTSINIKNYK